MAKQSAKAKGAEDILSKYSASMEPEFIQVEPVVINQLWGGGISPTAMYSMWGPQGCGKSTIALQVAKSLLKQGERVWWIDSEKALNTNQQKAFGVDTYIDNGQMRHLVIDTYLDLEEVIKAMHQIPKEDLPKLLVLDSESMLQPKISMDMSVEDNQPGLKAKQSNVVLNMMKQFCYRNSMASIVLFHARANISMKGGAQEEIKSAGGFAALHIPDCIVKITPGPRILENPSDNTSAQIGVQVRLMAEKNKFTSPRVVYTKSLIYGKGISKRRDIIDTALELGIIQKAGAGYFELPNGDKIRGAIALYEISNEQLKDLQTRINDAQ